LTELGETVKFKLVNQGRIRIVLGTAYDRTFEVADQPYEEKRGLWNTFLRDLEWFEEIR
jgi:hypothetical protein